MTHPSLLRSVSLLLMSCVALAACETQPNLHSDPTPDWQDVFWQTLSTYCGKSYAGELVSDNPMDVDFKGVPMVMHVAECSEDRIAIPFHVQQDGEWDRSRTWLVTRTDAGLRLKHDHRHEDGESDAVTMYGGDTADEGSARSQSFPVDDFSIALFDREGLYASVTNVWSIEVDPVQAADPIFAYQLERTVEGGALEDRLFRVEFDLTQEVETPPPAWGWE